MSITLNIKPGQMKFVTPPSFVQLALEIDTKSAIPHLVDYFSQSLAALHLRFIDDHTLEYSGDKILHYSLPSNNMTLKEAADFTAVNLTPKQEESYGCISVNDHQLILNASHRFCDGGFFKFLLNNLHISNKANNNNGSNIEYVIEKIKNFEKPILPHFTSDEFKDQIEKSPKIVPIPFNENVTRLHPKGIPLNQSHKHLALQEIQLKSNEFRNYDKNKDSPKNLTEMMWLAHFFVGSSFEGKLFDKFKTGTVVDLRPFLKYTPNLLNCYHCSTIWPEVPSINQNDTLRDVGSKLRKSLMDQRNQNFQFSIQKAAPMPGMKAIPGISLGFSSIGMLKIQKPIVDARISILMDAQKIEESKKESVSDSINIFSWSVNDGKRNDFFTQIGYNPNLFEQKDMIKFTKRVEYFLRNISLDQKVGEVYNIIKSIQ